MSILSNNERQAIEQYGTPTPIADDLTGETYILLSVQFVPDREQRGFTASIPGIAAYGEGATEQEASLALCEALRSYIDAFGNERPV